MEQVYEKKKRLKRKGPPEGGPLRIKPIMSQDFQLSLN